MLFKGIEVAPVYTKTGEVTKYVVSKDGRVFNTISGLELKRKIDTKGYYKVTISHGKLVKDERVHVLVAKAFVKNPNPEKFHIVNHLDGNKLNPVYTNLEWTDHHGNMKHAVDHNLINPARGEKSGRAILTDKQVHEICSLMEKGDMTQREISKLYNVPEYIIHEIKLGHNWKHISRFYMIENCKVTAQPLTKSVVIAICEEIMKNEKTIAEIADQFQVKYGRVLEILNGRNFKDITSKYDFSAYKMRRVMHKTVRG